MKFGYVCKCNWKLTRKGLTRPMYALRKVEHSRECSHLYDELKRSGKPLEHVRPAPR